MAGSTEGLRNLPNQERLHFFDTTLRDGEQSPGCSMTQHEKLAMAHSLADLGVDILEAGFAIASDGDFAAIDAMAREVRGPKMASLARARTEDIERAAKAWRRRRGRGSTYSWPARISILNTS